MSSVVLRLTAWEALVVVKLAAVKHFSQCSLWGDYKAAGIIQSSTSPAGAGSFLLQRRTKHLDPVLVVEVLQPNDHKKQTPITSHGLFWNSSTQLRLPLNETLGMGAFCCLV